MVAVAVSLLVAGCGGAGASSAGGAQTVNVVVQPPEAELSPSAAQAFAATVSGTTNTAVTWSVQEGASCGTVSGSGLYTAPVASATCHVVATSVADPGRSASAVVTIAGAGGTNIAGGAVTTQTWTAAGSPYRIYGDVHIPSGHRLTILPGVQVRFQGHYRMEGPGIIDARGTSPSQRDILFTAEDTTTGWYGIRIWNGTGSTTAPPDAGEYHVENCILEYAKKDSSRPRSFQDSVYNDSRGGALYIFGGATGTLPYSSFHINGNLFRYNSAWMAGAFNPIQIGGAGVWTDNEFIGNTSTGGPAGAFASYHGGAITLRRGGFINNIDQSGECGTVFNGDNGVLTLDGVAMSGNVPESFCTMYGSQVVVINPP